MPNHLWGQPFNTNGYNGYWPNPGVKTDGIPMPTARLDVLGNRPIFVGTIYRGYAAGPASIWHGIYYAGVETQGNHQFGGSGGDLTFFIRGSAGTLRFGRDEGAGRSVLSENEAFAWGGTLAGSMDWAQVPTIPLIPNSQGGQGNRYLFFGPGWSVADNGGSNVHSIIRQMAIDGGGWGYDTTNWAGTFEGTPGHAYTFRFSAVNSVGYSEWSYTPTYYIPYSGGRRMTGPAASTPLTISKRFNGTSWVDLTTRKRHTGSGFADIGN
jgi:hypothetical protein